MKSFKGGGALDASESERFAVLWDEGDDEMMIELSTSASDKPLTFFASAGGARRFANVLLVAAADLEVVK